VKAPTVNDTVRWSCIGFTILSEDETITGPRIATKEQGTPRFAWPGHKSRGSRGRVDGQKEQ